MIDDNVNIVQEELEKTTKDGEDYKKLEQVKESLLEMKESKPTLSDVERLFVLRDGFTE